MPNAVNPGEYFPLEFHWLSIDSIQIFEVGSFQIPFNLAFPGFDGLVTDTSQTGHRIEEDIGFGIRNLNRFVA